MDFAGEEKEGADSSEGDRFSAKECSSFLL